uniref:Enamelin n=1 Tax=Lepisosteus oculatus TaxID=7918 RepID=A0A125R3L1_LEPOC|nr:enamelin [Lepisosteus oculatus]
MKIALLVLCFLGTSLAFPIVPGAFSDSHEAKMQQYRWYGAPQQQRQQQYPFGISPQQWGIPSYGNAPQMMPFFPFGFPQRQAAVQSFEEEDSPRQPRPQAPPQQTPQMFPPFGNVPQMIPQVPVQKSPNGVPTSGNVPQEQPQRPGLQGPPEHSPIPNVPQLPEQPNQNFNPYGNVPQARPQLRPEFGPSYGEPQSRPQQPLPPSQDVYPSNGNIPHMRQDPPQQPSPDIVPSWPNSGLARRTPQQPQFIPNVRPSYSNAPQPRTQQPSQNVVPQYVPIPQAKPQPPMHPSPEVNPAIGNTPRRTQYPRQQQPPQLPPFTFQPQAGQQQQDFPKVVYVHLPPMAGMGPNTAAPAESEEAGAPQYGGYVPSFYGYGPFGFGNFGRRAPLSEEINEVNEKESESPGKPEAPAATEAPKAEDLPPTPGGVPTNTEGAGAAASANGTAANGAGNQPATEGGPNTPGSSPPKPEGAPAGPGGNTPAVGPNLPGRGDSGPNAGPSSPGVAGGFPVPGTNPLYPNLDPFAGVMWPAGVRKVTPSPSAGATQGFAEPGGEDATTPAPMGKGSPALNIPFSPSEGAKRNPSGIRKPPVQVPCNKGPHGPYGNGEQPGFVDPMNPDAEGIILAAADAIHGDSRVPCVVHDSPAQAEENHYYY